MTVDKDLMAAAARCYLLAERPVHALRCFEAMDEHRQAAALHEQLGRPDLAAQGFARACAWHEAARCFLATGAPERAGDCLMEGGEPLLAAWLYAHHAHRFDKAISVIMAHTAPLPPQPAPAPGYGHGHGLRRDLVHARCEAGKGRARAAGRRMAGIVATLTTLPHSAIRQDCEDWALAVAEALARADLIALIFAAAVRTGAPDAATRWETWAQRHLTDCTGIPLTAGAPS